MRQRFVILAMIALLMPAITSARGQQPDDDFAVHGTVNIALGNKNGLVLLTDSMLTSGGHQLSQAGQKLFKLDNRTVSSFAGFASESAPIPDLNTSTSSIIHEYVRQSAQQGPQSIAERLQTLVYLFRVHLQLISDVHNAGGNLIRLRNYSLQLIVAGYDIDGKPKIGRVALVANEKGGFLLEFPEISIINVTDKLVWTLSGMPDVAARLLSNPESGPRDSTLEEYAASKRANGGASLNVEQMVALVKRLAFYTSLAHPEVGGSNQIAIFKNSEDVRIEQQSFPEPPKPIVNFALFVDSHFTYTSFFVAPGVHGVFVRCTWKGMRWVLDDHFFMGNTFGDSRLVYGGAGDVNLGDTNRVTNSELVIEPLVDLNNENLRRLERAFRWSQIVLDFPRGSL